jgi:hypothetical protein
MMVKLLSVPSFRVGVVMFKVVSFGLKQKKKKTVICSLKIEREKG